jgi:hypothetical protein
MAFRDGVMYFGIGLCCVTCLYLISLLVAGGMLWSYHYKQACYSYFDTTAVHVNARVLEIVNDTVTVLYEFGDAIVVPISNASIPSYTTDVLDINKIRLNQVIPITYLEDYDSRYVYYGRVYDVWLEFMMLEHPVSTACVLALIITPLMSLWVILMMLCRK